MKGTHLPRSARLHQSVCGAGPVEANADHSAWSVVPRPSIIDTTNIGGPKSSVFQNMHQ